MAGRRCLALLAFAAVLLLIGSTGTSWAHPGNGKGHRHSGTEHRQGHTQLHVPHGNAGLHLNPHVRRAHHSTAGTESHGNQPASAPSVRTRSAPHGHAYGRTHSDLGNHPGRALGLFKHAPRPGGGGGPNGTPTPTGGGGSPVPPPAGHQGQPPVQPVPQGPTPNPAPSGSGPGSSSPVPSPSGSQSEPPPPAPTPSEQPRPPWQGNADRYFGHSGDMRFTALPIIVISALAIGVCGLIALARHRA